MSDAQKRIEQLSPKQRELLRRRLAQKNAGTAPPALTAIPRQDRETRRFPLSFSQLRQWILEQLEPGTAAYNLPAPMRLDGGLDTAALERSFAEILRRQEGLRTTFEPAGGETGDGEPVQVIHDPWRLRLPVVDLGDLDGGALEAEEHRLAAADAERPFDLRRGPLFRLALLRRGAAAHTLLFTLHHIVSDGWSRGVVFRDLEQLYPLFAAGRRPELGAEDGGAPAVQYADFAVWQRQRLRGAELETLLSYWRERLASPPPPLELPADRPRPAVLDHTGGEVERVLAPALVRALGELARERGASLFMVLLAGFDALLHRLTGSRDLSTGTFIANRNRPEIAGVVGFFVNTLVLRTAVDPAAGFGALLAAAKETSLGAFAHQDLPFEKLVEELQPERSTRHTPFFQTMLVLQNARRRELELPGVAVSYLGEEHRRANFDLTLWLWQEEETLTAVAEYRSSLFDRATVERWLGHLEVLLTAAVAAPERPVGHLPLLTPAEAQQLRAASLGPGAAAGREPVIQAFARAAVAKPDAVALEHRGRSVTYGQLAATAARLAEALRRHGVGAEVRVAVCLERSPELIAALLGVLAAGGAYVPVDPAYPEARRRLMIEDSGAAVVIAAEDVDLGPSAPRRLVPAILGAADRDLDDLRWAGDPHRQQAAYVIYTSGSTGKPKGVVVPHACLSGYTADAIATYGVGAGDRLLQFASASFDASAEEIYPALLSGATLVLRDDAMVASVDAFLRALDELAITVLNLPTAYWHQICAHLDEQAGGAALPARLARVIIGGEEARGEALDQWRRHAPPGLELVNTYGPTEATIVATRHALRCLPPSTGTAAGEGARAPIERPPIGKPVAGGSAWVLDRRGELCAPGVAGELHLGGGGIARGYLGRPALTAERFVPDPFAAPEKAGARLYRTGDLACWRPGDVLEFRGRADHQVKVRGYRIELGEVEAVLESHPEIAQAAATTLPDGAGGARLAAYLVPAGEAVPAVAELRRWLGERLPEHMVPSVWSVLDQLPRTAGGKIDRRALPAPDSARPELGHAYEAPRTAVETTLAEIWSDLLGVEEIGRRDSFFDLGGHSLLVTRLAARLREAFGVEIPLLDLFNSPTLEQLGRVVEAAEPGASTLPPMTHADRSKPLPLSFPQERVWFLNRLLPGNLAYNFVFAVRLHGPLVPAVLHRVLTEVLRRHEIFRTTFPAQGDKPVQVVHPPMPAHLPAIDLSRLPAPERSPEAERLAAAGGRRPFDVERLPLIRWTLIRHDPSDHELVQIEQHLVHDGWSVAVFLREMQALYEAFVAGEPSPLPEPRWQFADFAAWQQGWLQGEAYEAVASYWRRQLAGAPLVLELPLDHPRPKVNQHRGALHVLELSYDFYKKLRDFDRRESVSLYMTMLAAYFALLNRLTQQRDVLVGAGVANRRLKESEDLIGMIVNTIVLRGEMGDDPSFRELVHRVRRTTLEAHSHQDMPFDKLVGELHPQRDLSRNPIFQTMFSFHDSQVPYIRFGGLEGHLEGAHNRSAKLDLNVVVLPHAEQHVGLEGPDDPRAEGVVMYWEYNTDLFDESTAQRWAEAYRRLLEAVVEAPDLPVSRLPLLSEQERRQLLVEWNDTAAAYPAAPIHRLFEERARLHPESTALDLGSERVTYGELEAEANRLARRLRHLGVGAETPVGLCLERSRALIVAELAVLKAGGVFVPLDPAYGETRLAFMLEDTAAPVVVTRGGLLPPATAAGAVATTILDLEAEAEALASEASEALDDGDESPDRLAYVMYTSGSTGVPKGVAVPHRAVVRLVRGNRFARFGPGTAFLGFAPASFDASTLEIWAPLLGGGRLVLPPPGPLALEDLAALVAAAGVDHLWLTAGLFHQMVEGPIDKLRGLRRLLAGGDVLSPSHVRKALEALPDTTLINGYGPTENTTFTTTHAMDDAAAVGDPVPIGRPISNTRVYVLDAHRRPVPVGVAGELYAGGDGLARGYFRRPAATAERFVPDPTPGAEPGARLYRTGDRVRWLPGGVLDFLGRTDQQVKVRGYRIEPGEIETALRRHEAIAEAAVVARSGDAGSAGDKRLVAYLVPTAGTDAEAFAAVDWRAFLRRDLPEYLVPSAFVTLEALPLNANGKLDRAALQRLKTPAPELAGSAAGREPETELESYLVALWQELLGVERVGLDDDFFELGGHSLVATQVISRLRQGRGVEAPLGLLFEHPTVAGLAAAVEELTPMPAAPGHVAAAALSVSEAAAELPPGAEDLSDEELDELLRSMIEGEAGA